MSAVTLAEHILTDKSEEVINLLSTEWKNDLKGQSEVRAAVSMAHRTILVEREGAIVFYGTSLLHMISVIQSTFGALIAQEASWNERWMRQVEMLRRGNI